MADQSFNQLYARMNTMLRDPDDFTFSQAEKQEALGRALDDPAVYKITRDTSTVIVASKASYPVPSGLEGVTEVGYEPWADGFYKPLDRGAWDEIDGTIYLTRSYMGLPAGQKLWLTAAYKFSNADLIPTFLQEYVLNLGVANTIDILKEGKSNRFLRNDITMSELIAVGQGARSRANELRMSLRNRRAVRS